MSGLTEEEKRVLQDDDINHDAIRSALHTPDSSNAMGPAVQLCTTQPRHATVPHAQRDCSSAAIDAHAAVRHSFATFGVEPTGESSWKLNSPRSLKLLRLSGLSVSDLKPKPMECFQKEGNTRVHPQFGTNEISSIRGPTCV